MVEGLGDWERASSGLGLGLELELELDKAWSGASG